MELGAELGALCSLFTLRGRSFRRVILEAWRLDQLSLGTFKMEGPLLTET